MAISLTRLSGGNTPADGSDPRTFPAIWNASATAIEAALAEGGGASVTVSDTAPVSPAEGDLWWDSGDGKLFVYYVDGDSSQWVDAAGPSVAVQDTAPTGYEGQLWLDSTDGSMYVYYTDPGGANSQWIGAVSRSGGVLQVVSTTKTDVFSASVAAGNFVDISGLSATITPRSTSSKILASYTVHLTRSDNNAIAATRIARNSTGIGVGDSAGTRSSATSASAVASSNAANLVVNTGQFLDSPSTTSSLLYKVQMNILFSSGSGTMRVNYTNSDTDNPGFPRTVSTLTLMEIAG